ncbi:hypothetical protein H0H92_002552 [Tricholoma furcatifolium]|nr:hypothetical protein H0H92_002552 [Tricholoma furcatifolium]
MATHVARLSRLFTPEYARRINAQIVYPSQAVVVKPHELESALGRPINVSIYEPHRDAQYLAATLSYGLIKGHPFMDGNKRTGISFVLRAAFFIANEYLRVMGDPTGTVGDLNESAAELAQRHVYVAAGKLDVEGLANSSL